MCATSPITLEIDTLLDDDPSYYHQISRAILSDLTQYPDLFTQLLQGFLTYPLKYSSQRIIDFINHIPSSKMIQEFEQFQQNLNESSEIPKDPGQLIIAFCNLILHHLSDAERQFNQILEHFPKISMHSMVSQYMSIDRIKIRAQFRFSSVLFILILIIPFFRSFRNDLWR